jgi:hypothetical protein
MTRKTPHPLVTEKMIFDQKWERRQGPFYSVHEVAKVVFGMSPSWLRLKMTAKPERPMTSFVDAGGQAMTFLRRDPEDEVSARVFTLADFEPMARSLRSFGDISDERLDLIMQLVVVQAKMFGLIQNEPPAKKA